MITPSMLMEGGGKLLRRELRTGPGQKSIRTWKNHELPIFFVVLFKVQTSRRVLICIFSRSLFFLSRKNKKQPAGPQLHIFSPKNSARRLSKNSLEPPLRIITAMLPRGAFKKIVVS